MARPARRAAGALALFALGTGVVAAGPGALDRSFGAGFGYVRYADSTMIVEDNGLGVAAQADGKIVAAGTSGITQGAVVLRFNADGTLDPTFGALGVFRFEHETEVAVARRVVVRPDGRLLILGYLQSATKLLLMQLLPDGTLDPSFGTAGMTVATAAGWLTDVRRIVIDGAGRAIVIWEPIDPSLNRIRVSRFRADGRVDGDWNFGDIETVLDTSGFGAVTVLPMGAALDPEGKLLIFASAYNASANTTLIYRLGPDGFPDASFGNNGRLAYRQANFAFWGRNWTALPAGNGFVLVEWTGTGVRLEKFNLNGTIATQFGTFGHAEFTFSFGSVRPGNAVIRGDGTIVVTGTRIQGAINEIFLLAVAPDGTLDTRFGANVPQRVYAGADVGRPPELASADIALVGGTAFAIAGTSANPAGLNDLLALRVDATGALVASFGGKGGVTWDGGDVVPESAQGVWLQPGGKLLVLDRTARNWNWRRFLPDGNPDTSFGTGGKRVLAENWDAPGNTQILTQADGRIVLARQARGPTFTSVTRVVRYLASGERDATFGTDGALEFIDDAQEDPVRPGLAQLDDGRLLVATHGTSGMRLRRFLANGDVDVTFGNGTGLVFPALHGRPQVSYTLAVLPDGRILTGAATTVIRQAPLPQIPVYSDVVARLTPDGLLDPTYGVQSGVVPIQIENARDPQILRIMPLPDGKTIVAGNITRHGAQQFFFLRLNADGTVDTGFGDHTDGADGPGPFIWSNATRSELRDAVLDAQGRLVITGSYLKTSAGRTQVFVVRFLPDGTIDGAFGGIHEHIFLFERPDPTGAGNAIALGANSIFVAGEAGELGLLMKLEADGSALAPSRSVVEFHNTLLNHYFITADPDEAAAIEAGAAGPGWQRTGRGFRAWLAETGVASIAMPVCRFYGRPGVGPNSHFYTADPLECDAVRDDPGWQFEGIAFYSAVPLEGTCPVGMQAVLRVYNNRFAANDSNHRYLTNLAIYVAMQQQGWLPEGVVLCSPP